MAHQQIQWGTVSLLLDQDRLTQGYQRGRCFFFEDSSLQEQAAHPLTVTEVLRLVAVPDEQGYYQLENGRESTDFPEGVEEMIGVLLGYLADPLYEETPEEQEQRQAMCLVVVQNPHAPQAATKEEVCLPEIVGA